MSEIDLNKEYNSLIKEVAVPIFKNLGFKRNANNFFRATNELIQTFNFQKSSFDKQELSFCGNIGIIEPDTYMKLYEKTSLPKFPKCTDAIIQFRMGYLTHGGDYWYKLSKRLGLGNLYIPLEKDMEVVRIFFESHTTLFSIEHLFSDRTKIDITWGAVGQFALYKKIGKDKIAHQILKETYKEYLKPKSWTILSEKINGIWRDTKPEPTINKFWIEKIEKVAKLYKEKIK